MKTIVTILLAACALASLASAQATSSSQSGPAGQQNAAANSAQSSIVVREVDLEGLKKVLRREGEHARPLAVNFWGTFCDPCRDEMPDLVRINSEFQSRGLEFILVSVVDPSDIKKKVPQFLQQAGATAMPAYLINASDPETIINAVDPAWNGGLPATFLYDAQGHLVFKHTSRVNPAELRQAVQKVISDE